MCVRVLVFWGGGGVDPKSKIESYCTYRNTYECTYMIILIYVYIYIQIYVYTQVYAYVHEHIQRVYCRHIYI